MVDPVVYICSAGHSGSTLLDLILGAHPLGLAVGEITHLPKNIALDSTCSCGHAVSKCAFWKPFVDAYGRELGIDLWDDPYRLDLGFIMAGREIDRRHQTRWRMAQRKLVLGAAYARYRWSIKAPMPGSYYLRRAATSKYRLFHFLLRETSKSFVVDSSKHYIDALELSNVAGGGIKVIHLVRDGRAVFASGLRRGMSRDAALSAWLSHSQRSLPLLNKYMPSGKLITVHYESLAAETEPELRRISQFIGIEYEPSMLDFASARPHILNGNRMRFSDSSMIHLDEKWRRELEPSDVDYFQARAGKVNRELGYD